MTTLNLGVIVMPYAYDTKAKGKGKKKKAASRSITTAEVADLLEDKYHLMETFYEAYKKDIVKNITESLAGSIESLVMGAPAHADPFAAGTQQIAEQFKQFILSGEAERLGIPGTPTKAALKGVSHRKAHPYAKANPPRVSFYDTGMYVDNFMSWID